MLELDAARDQASRVPHARSVAFVSPEILIGVSSGRAEVRGREASLVERRRHVGVRPPRVEHVDAGRDDVVQVDADTAHGGAFPAHVVDEPPERSGAVGAEPRCVEFAARGRLDRVATGVVAV